MEEKDLILFLGYSIHEPLLKQHLQQFRIELDNGDNLDVSGFQYDVNATNDRHDIFLTYNGNKRYTSGFGTPIGLLDEDGDELILTEVTFDNHYYDTQIPFPTSLPYDLKQGDTDKEVIRKLGKKPFERMKVNYGQAWWFNMGTFRLLTALDAGNKLIWIRCIQFSRNELSQMELKRMLGRQRKNIRPERVPQLEQLKKEIPTIQWKKRMTDGDDLFTPENIGVVETCLLSFLEKIMEHTEKKKAGPIYTSVKRLVQQINRINLDYDAFIETMEREELCEFIDKAVTTTGFIIENDLDITAPWREW